MKYFQTGFRLSKADKANLKEDGLHVYERRDNGNDDTIEPSVLVDFMGTLITDFPIDFPVDGPSAYTIYDGNLYLESIGAKEVSKISELK